MKSNFFIRVFSYKSKKCLRKLHLIWTFFSLLQIEYMDIQVLAHIFPYWFGKQNITTTWNSGVSHYYMNWYNGADVIFLLKDGWSLFMNRLSFSSLSFFSGSLVFYCQNTKIVFRILHDYKIVKDCQRNHS